MRLLRALDISIPDIKRLQNGSVSLDQVLASRLEKLQQEKDRLDTIGTLCRRLQEEHTDFENLDVSIADNDRLWTEQFHGIFLCFCRSAKHSESRFQHGRQYISALIYMLLLVTGLIITFRNDLYIYRTYEKNFFHLSDIDNS